MANQPLLNRREFIRILATVVAAVPLSSLAENRSQKISSVSYKESNQIKDPWLTIVHVQEHLFPTEKDSPGSKDIHALEYLRAMMDTPDFDKDEHALIHNGVGWLNDLSRQQYSEKFIQLDNDSKEKILRRVETSRAGENWLSTLLNYLLEALLTDPVYGGNPDGIGWEWLQHQPGFPRPSINKKYFKLGAIRYRNIKA